jgi:hypothetical protein
MRRFLKEKRAELLLVAAIGMAWAASAAWTL